MSTSHQPEVRGLGVVATAIKATLPSASGRRHDQDQIVGNVQASQWDPSPLALLPIQPGTSLEWDMT
jgi:hypothetical protein